jgi:hypothetical protein
MGNIIPLHNKINIKNAPFILSFAIAYAASEDKKIAIELAVIEYKILLRYGLPRFVSSQTYFIFSIKPKEFGSE